MDIKNNFIGGGDSSSEKYNKDTYIGYLKMKKGGMKIISGDKDEQIIATRNKILSHLDIVLSGGKRLKEKNIKKYFKALGGKYVRNDMCISGDNSNCKNGRNVSVRGAHKLLKLISKKNLPIDSSLETFKGSAPELYEKLENKIKGGYNAIGYDSDGNNKNSNNSSGGGPHDDCEPEKCNVSGISVKLISDRYAGDFRKLRGFKCDVIFDVDYFNDDSSFRKEVLNLLSESTGMRNTQLATSSNVNGRTWADFKAFLAAAESEIIIDGDMSAKTYLSITKKPTGLISQITNTPTISVPNCKKGANAIEDENEFMSLLVKWGYNRLHSRLISKMEARNYDANRSYGSKSWHGGYDSNERDYYPEERRGGYDNNERDYYPEERRGGYDSNERDYYPEERRGGYDRRDDYYPDEMHGGNLGLFRNEIRNNITDLRQEILNIVLN